MFVLEVLVTLSAAMHRFRLSGASGIPETAVFEPTGRGVLDGPVSSAKPRFAFCRAMTSVAMTSV
jgi:hypothetical protein